MPDSEIPAEKRSRRTYNASRGRSGNKAIVSLYVLFSKQFGNSTFSIYSLFPIDLMESHQLLALMLIITDCVHHGNGMIPVTIIMLPMFDDSATEDDQEVECIIVRNLWLLQVSYVL